jgi:adenylosuccinate lyase
MISRYARPEMARIWTPDAKYEAWLQVELAVCEVYARRGLIPVDALGRIKARARVQAGRIDEIEVTTRHDVIAFLTNLEEALGADSRYVHMGLTSSDVVDTALALQLQQASDLLLAGLERFRGSVRTLALAHRDTLCVGRTHGIHAEPMVFGLKAALWYSEAGRNVERLRRAREAVRVGKLSGAVGTFAHVDPDVEEEACRLLGLEAAAISNQIVQRDRHAEFSATLAIIAASLEKVATEIRALQRTEILEAEEPFTAGQKGSSAMPHKRNPVSCEQVCGLARLVRTNALAALENVALWHERDISHSSVERVVGPDATMALDFALHRFAGMIESLRVYPERMLQNLELTGGLYEAQRVLLALVGKGVARQQAYVWVQRNAMKVWEERVDFQTALKGDPDVRQALGEEEIAACFALGHHLKHVDAIFERVFGKGS